MRALKHYISITFKENPLGCHILIGMASKSIVIILFEVALTSTLSKVSKIRMNLQFFIT
jgi:hypothetical protein